MQDLLEAVDDVGKLDTHMLMPYVLVWSSAQGEGHDCDGEIVEDNSALRAIRHKYIRDCTIDMTAQTFEACNWKIAYHEDDSKCALQNVANHKMQVPILSFFEGKYQWPGTLLSRAGMKISSEEAAKVHEEEAARKDNVGTKNDILTIAAEKKRDNMAEARAKRIPASRPSTPLSLEAPKGKRARTKQQGKVD